MSQEGGGSRLSSDDSLLRAIARTPDASPEPAGEPDPARLGRFRILGRLGSGGMGIVYRAQDESLGRAVALKVLPPAQVQDGERRQRFLREARTAAAVTHPNVVSVHEIGEIDGRAYIAMELVPGESLRARLQGGPLPGAMARDLATQIAQGLAAAHERGIVHRDLKPENVMVTPTGAAKLLDFGLAKPDVDSSVSAAALESADTELQVTVEQARVMGTAHYMSPEQALGEPLTVRSDVFSFGVLLYEMLAGTRPFQGATAGKILVSIARDAPPPLRELVPDVDPTLDAIVQRSLEKNAQDRFGSASQIVAALASQAALVLRASARPAARSKLLAPSVAVLAVLLLGGGAIAIRTRHANSDSPLAATSAEPSLAAMAPAGCVGSACNAIVDVTSGMAFGCVALASGTVWCWGDNTSGQLGTNDHDETCTFAGRKQACRPAPAPVPGVTRAVAISAGDGFACALGAGGLVTCWGRNDHAQLGHAAGSAGDEACIGAAGAGDAGGPAAFCNPRPTPVPGLPTIKAVSVGGLHACALSTGGVVYCWGDSSLGQTGRGVATTTSAPAPIAGGPIPGQPDAGALPIMTLVVSGASKACAVDVHLTLWCWGDNMYGGGLGHPTGTNDDRTVSNVPGGLWGHTYNPWPQVVLKDAAGVPAPIEHVGALATPSATTCAVSDLDGLQCWGWALAGLDGDPGWAKNSTWRPNHVETPVPLRSLSGTMFHICAIGADASVFCWGRNYHGQLGRGIVGGGQDPKACWCGACCYYTPQPVPGLHATKISASGTFSLALGSDGALYGWGANGAGETGHLAGSRGDLECGGENAAEPLEQCVPDPVRVEGLP